MEYKNIKEFKELIIKYQELVDNPDLIPDFEEGEYGHYIMHQITGFGHEATCMLCKYRCSYCIYSNLDTIYFSCCRGRYKKSYFAIESAASKSELIEALKLRIIRMKERLKELNL